MKNLNLYWSRLLHPSRQSAPTGSKPSGVTPSSAPSVDSSSSLVPASVERPANSAWDLFSQLIDMGQYDMAMRVLQTSITAKGEDHAWDY